MRASVDDEARARGALRRWAASKKRRRKGEWRVAAAHRGLEEGELLRGMSTFFAEARSGVAMGRERYNRVGTNKRWTRHVVLQPLPRL